MLQVWISKSFISTLRLNPFEVREVLQGVSVRVVRCCVGLNPFEVREVLQERCARLLKCLWSLNPFEVREVLQDFSLLIPQIHYVSIPLKSGRCCKAIEEDGTDENSLNPFEVREVLQANVRPPSERKWVSIPLKSGRCCKILNLNNKKVIPSQSL